MARLTGRFARRVVERHRQALEVGVFVLAAGWHLGNDLPMLLANRHLYTSFTTAAVAWVALTAVICHVGRRLLVSPEPPRGALPLAALVLALGTAVVLVCPPGQLVSMANWAFGTVGWTTLLVLVREPRHTVAVIALGPVATLGALLWHQAYDQLPAFVIAGYGICALQVAVAVGAHLVRVNAEIAVEQARIAVEREIEKLYAEDALTDRVRRYLAVRPTTEALLVGLADGTLSPDHPEVRARCALEAATLRRLCLEGNEVLHPLLRDLHDCADRARDRGVRVDLHTAGEVGDVPDDVRAGLVEITRLCCTRARAGVRLTVLATATDLVLGGVADGPLPGDGSPLPPDVTTRYGDTADGYWWEARWHNRSAYS
ncbi:hypothetical protein [Asanoa siamensis]|uniref:Histidine kinase n=1 Tax=Asanoa siamensis TaxID=926357 RepID=A0ABQ4CK71_9ACTN|nr:hypothetical protein [Asanoa siamensis]GIF71688.1 hypothetical protein Asi02nite_12060 [Asanoa siamensis]